MRFKFSTRNSWGTLFQVCPIWHTLSLESSNARRARLTVAFPEALSIVTRASRHTGLNPLSKLFNVDLSSCDGDAARETQRQQRTSASKGAATSEGGSSCANSRSSRWRGAQLDVRRGRFRALALAAARIRTALAASSRSVGASSASSVSSSSSDSQGAAIMAPTKCLHMYPHDGHPRVACATGTREVRLARIDEVSLE